MKKILLTLAFAAAGALLMPTSAVAQDAPKPEGATKPEAARAEGARNRMSPEERLATMKKNLDLTAEQEAKIKASMEQTQAKMRELRQDTALSAEDRRSKMTEIRKTSQQEINAVLTPDQLEKQKKLRPEGRGGRRNQDNN